MKVVTLKTSEIIPYWRNPRRITDEAVEAVMQSIREYGYQQPIVVDSDRVIVMGHTRWSALRRLGVQEIEVIMASDLTQKQARELRTIDNRTSEYTRWDFEKLVDELGDLDSDLMAGFFPEVIGSTSELEIDDNPSRVDEMIVDMFEKPAAQPAEFVCPHCFHSWEMLVSKEDVLSGHLEVKK